MTIRLLGLDPGLRATGWGVVDAEGNLLSAVANGTVRTDGKAPLAERLYVISRQLKKLYANTALRNVRSRKHS